MNLTNKFIQIAQIGKTVGLKGELKLHIKSDFPEQFKKGNRFFTIDENILTIEKYNKNRSVVKFIEYNNKEDASVLTNQFLYSTIEKSRENCNLSKDEYFWFDIIGSLIYENEELLGQVISIERFEPNDFIIIKTDLKLVKNGYPNQFMIPYIDRYILDFDKNKKIIYTKDTKGILENS